jgi:hypothetical protein
MIVLLACADDAVRQCPLHVDSCRSRGALGRAGIRPNATSTATISKVRFTWTADVDADLVRFGAKATAECPVLFWSGGKLARPTGFEPVTSAFGGRVLT